MIKKYIFNFSVSRSGGGYKRLYEYARALNSRGGAHFIIHPECYSLAKQFPNNVYHIVRQTKVRRFLNDFGYLSAITDAYGPLDFYYSYGIPIPLKVAKVNWFHLSNVLPLAPSGMRMTLLDAFKMRLLGSRIRSSFKNADVISAESEYSLGLIGRQPKQKLFLSVNGSDDEIKFLSNASHKTKKDLAVVMGTYRHKAIEESYHLFKMLKKTRSANLKMLLAGDPMRIPEIIKLDPDVIVAGHLTRNDLIDVLGDSKFYLSTTYIENSYNAASEGIFLAQESYISNIQPHLELLEGESYKFTAIPGLSRPFLHIERKSLSGVNIKSWDEVVDQMIGELHRLLNAKTN